MTTFYAQPYDISATGFYFEDARTYQANINGVTNDYGDPVEEFEIQFIDGDDLDSALANALGLYQNTILQFMDGITEWDNDQKLKILIAVGEAGYSFDLNSSDPDDFEVNLYPDTTMRELAEQFIDEGLFGEIADNIACYLDYDAIVRDLAMDYTETTIAGARYVYRCR